jgi:hypothetical protein
MACDLNPYKTYRVFDSHSRIEFVDGDSHHQVVPDDPAAHAPLSEKGETAEHFPFVEALSIAEFSPNSVCEPFVVRHVFIGPRSDPHPRC